MNETNWQPTRHGGLRRTRVASNTGTQEGHGVEPEAIARAAGKAKRTLGITKVMQSPHTGKIGGSNPSPRTFIIKFNERLGLPTCPYLIRWRVETKWGSVRLHHWISSDDPRALHDHPWDFVTFVIKGGYTDKNPTGEQHLKAPKVQYRSATHQHTVYPDPGGAWTVVITGPKIRPWGFWVSGKFKKANKYFASHGHHPCS